MTDPKKLQEEAIKQGIKNALIEQKKSDPLAGVKFGCKQVINHILTVLKDEKGVHFESFLAVLGSLGGYACQMAAHDKMKASNKLTEEDNLVIVTDSGGKKYYFGNFINEPLAESQYSIWSLVVGALENLKKTPPDIGEIFEHVSKTVGTDQFGVPRIPDGHSPARSPIEFLKEAGPHLYPIAKEYCDTPEELPLLFALAIQQAIFMGEQTLDPVKSAVIVMECAIPMSKVDLVGS